MVNILDKDFKQIICEIKSKIDNTKIEIFQNANMSLLNLYYYIGQTLVENSKYGSDFINNLSIELKISYPNMKGFSVRNLKNMRKYYLVCSNNKKVQKASALIPWSHNILIFDKIKDDEKRIWYINQTAKNGWGYYDLLDEIKYNAYSRYKAVKNNPNKFPERYSFILTVEETKNLRSKFLTANYSNMSRSNPSVFTEQDLLTYVKSLFNNQKNKKRQNSPLPPNINYLYNSITLA